MVFTPLSIAAQLGNVQEVLALIEAGADINVCNHIGWTPLYMAAGNGHDGVVEALIAANVDIDKTDDIGWTPLLKATEYGHETTVQIPTHYRHAATTITQSNLQPQHPLKRMVLQPICSGQSNVPKENGEEA